MAANEFDHPLVAASYDTVDGPRDDLLHYRDLLSELGARSVLDIGCGTGEFALLLAREGLSVVGLEPAGAMLDVARAKNGADTVIWVHGDVSMLSEAGAASFPVDAVVMTGNVAQVFLTDEEWLRTLRAAHDALAPGGHLVFETRIPERRAWEAWAESEPFAYELPGIGEVAESLEVTEVAEPFVTFESRMRLPDGVEHVARSTLIFRSMEELQQSLGEAGLVIADVRDAPDRPGAEWVVIARR